jgi:hypothetical protein
MWRNPAIAFAEIRGYEERDAGMARAGRPPKCLLSGGSLRRADRAVPARALRQTVAERR